MGQKLKRVLIANRGEIAIRIMRTLRELGIESVAVYSDADAGSMHRQLADFAVRLPGRASKDTYLNIPALLKAVETSGADGVHPGYGFLSENQGFAQQLIDAGVTFIGPSPRSMAAMGEKIAARNLMKKVGVPIVPGSDGPLNSLEELQGYAKSIGYPLILKASGGGGGRGMRVVRKDADLADAFAACQREAVAYFGNPEVFCERYIDAPRHIEFQVLFDKHGNGVHLFERDCTIQRRHQKLFEEAPSAFLDAEHRERLGEIAVRAAQAAHYDSVGTVEMICESPDRAYFMEMNTRIQVEHPVSELITGVDLIREQILVAMGERLRFKQADIKLHGWAMEARINAESVERDFMPTPGTVLGLHVPGGPFVRFDSHVYPGYTIPSEYDSMIGKLIVWAPDRDQAAARLQRALDELRIDGVTTTARFQRRLLGHPDFRESRMDTTWIERNRESLTQATPLTANSHDAAAFAAALAVGLSSESHCAWTASEREQWQRVGRHETQRA
jgi:acetyl-CoA carboxylase biotin carboxylase subunit